MDKRGQAGLTIGLIGFWLLLSFTMTLYRFSDFPTISGLTDNNVNESLLTRNVDTLSEDQAGFFGSIVRLINFILSFSITFLKMITFWFPIFDSIIATMVIGIFFLILKIATWWSLIRFWV